MIIWGVAGWYVVEASRGNVSDAFSAAVATFASATATTILVGITYLYTRHTRRLVVETRKDRHREAVLTLITEGIQPLVDQLESQHATVESRTSLRDGSFPHIPSEFADEDELIGNIPTHVLLDIEDEINNFTTDDLSKYCDNWKIYREKRSSIHESLTTSVSLLSGTSQEDSEISEEKLSKIADDIESVYPNIGRYDWSPIDFFVRNGVAEEPEDYIEFPHLVLSDFDRPIAGTLLQLPVVDGNEHQVAYKNTDEKTCHLNYDALFALLEDDLMPLRQQGDIQDDFDDLDSAYATATEHQSNLILILSSTLERLKDEYDIRNIHLERHE